MTRESDLTQDFGFRLHQLLVREDLVISPCQFTSPGEELRWAYPQRTHERFEFDNSQSFSTLQFLEQDLFREVEPEEAR